MYISRKKLILIGASGHGKVCADIAKLCGYDDIVFLDNDLNVKECAGYSVLGPDAMTDELDGDLFISIGNANIRKRLMEQFRYRRFPVLIHPGSIISKDVDIGNGSVIMAGVVINTGTEIGKGCIINTSSSIDHDCNIGNYSHISVGSHLSGSVSVGEKVWIGTGASVSNNVDICNECVIGAGAVVIRTISEKGTYIGVPAKKMNKKNRQ